jgi:hypothetical protein
MCLRPDSSQGYAFCSCFSRTYNLILIGSPPPDATLRSWVLSGDTNNQVPTRKRLHGFVYSLLTVTRATLETIGSQSEKEGEMAETESYVAKRSWHLPSATT